MAGNIENKYGTNGQTLTVTLASLANNGQRQSTMVDNTSNVFQDVLVLLKVKSGASGVSATGSVNIYGLATVDGDTTITENGTTTDAAITLTSPPNARLIGIVNVVANATTYIAGPFSVASAFGGVLPDHWGIVVENKTGAALDSTEGNHAKLWQGVFTQYT